ncbi:TusE/DsrC/DsvC family sulfur relay protein [Endozoicomonas sp. SCSIO W0465]|uniref:TusE/DsrC/DsvC family sulfur relay protein n=1 Tax=Endozoicomonas sp. SCSIO W0465 TaxID=2918516 RepID=UPI0020753F5E|nr:TusE/DsrC/DsvC family sulfur relay protein [Endozoicomonas sp. SCSIO W0465]USE33941.1 TusE/DsrC/DsvC family sulfur relay protein [Endozoicomonas sp. SCSIO W0465]
MPLNLDNDGYLANLDQWNADVATELAALEGIALTDAHWEVIYALRAFYQQYELAPNQRPFVKHIANTLGKEKGNSLYLMQLFPESPARVAARIAGLPRPTNCF